MSTQPRKPATPKRVAASALLARLEQVQQAMHDQFPESLARLEQLDDHCATVAMVIGHIYDEAARAAVDGRPPQADRV